VQEDASRRRMERIYIVGTADTKGEELSYTAREIAAAGGTPLIVDVGTRQPRCAVDIAAKEVARHHPDGADAVLGPDDRGTAVAAMGAAFARFVASRNDIAGIVGIGGSGGTSIVTAGMRELPIGLPKLMVSTVAAGDVGAYVGVSDIAMMYSVTDIAGLNRISRLVIANAAHAVAGMVRAARAEPEGKPSIGLTMFGVTTPCVTQAVDLLKDTYDCIVFHATGTGGRAMEKLAESGMVTGIVDATTTEIADLLFGGVLAASEDRLGAVARTQLPYVGSVGALDMVNFRAPETIPDRYRQRTFYRHNPNVTLMRTTADENWQMGVWIAERLNRCDGSVRLLIPELGVSALDAPGQPFHDRQADAALFAAIEEHLVRTADRRLVRLPWHINDRRFSEALARTFRDIAR
jgi:uncharacterized protein (UPF0261 family)